MSDTRNGTLKDIVRAYGSEPQSTTRNGLLQEWLTAVSVIFRLALDGITNYLSHSQWTPTGVNFRLELKVRFDAGSIGANTTILSDQDSSVERLAKNISNQIEMFYIDSGGTQRFLSVSATTIVADTDYIVTIDSDGNGVSLDVNGNSNSRTDVIDPADVNIIHIAANNTGTSNFVGGRIWDVKYTDESFIQNGDFLKGNGVDVNGNLNIPVGVGATVAIEYRVSTTTFDHYLIDGLDATDRPYIFHQNAGQALRFNGSVFSNVTVDGAVVTDGSITLVVGQTYKIVATVSAATTIGRFLSRYTDTDFSGGIAANVLITNGTDTYQYLCNNVIDNGDGTGTVPNTGNTGSSFDMTVNNFTALDDLETVAQNSRFYPVNDGSGTNVRDALGTGSTDATINGTPDWEAM